MKPALAYREPYYPESWLDLPNGNVILEEINHVLSPWWPKFFGYHMLKIGSLSHTVESESCPIKHQVNVAHHGEKSAVIADIDDLPMLEHSVDVCLLSHALEFSVDPHHVLREANRVLIPNGYLVITGYNPISLAGVNKLIPYRRSKVPWKEHFFTPMRVKDWLNLMGFEILEDKRCLHSMLSNNVKHGKFVNYWQSIANNYFSSLGSIYIVVAKKRVHPLTPIRPKWKIRTGFQPVKVSTMNSSHRHFIKRNKQ